MTDIQKTDIDELFERVHEGHLWERADTNSRNAVNSDLPKSLLSFDAIDYDPTGHSHDFSKGRRT